MVVRKPVAKPRVQAAQGIPYPVTPTSPRGERTRIAVSANGGASESYTAGTTQFHWGGDSNNDTNGQEEGTIDHDLPPSLAVGGGSQDNERGRSESIPAILQVGSAAVTPKSSWESHTSNNNASHVAPSKISQPDGVRSEQVAPARPRSTSNNPYYRLHNSNGKVPDRSDYNGAKSTEIWGSDSTTSQPQSGSTPSRHPFAEPWMHFGTSPVEPNMPLAQGGSHAANNESISEPAAQNLIDTDARASEAPEVLVQSPSSAPQSYPQGYGLGQACLNPPNVGDQTLGSLNTEVGDVQYPPLDSATGPPASPGCVHLGPNHYTNNLNQDQSSPLSNTVQTPRDSLPTGRVAPVLPPRVSEESQVFPLPANTSEKAVGEAPKESETQAQGQEVATKRRAVETYQIRLVNWYDASSPMNPRRSPIMVQNANGPCPLLALVNALVLSTPSGIATALVETLRVREQVSLGLLLDAVIEELMSPRRADAVGKLPDVTDLYAFLVNLHTGMNVNPRFVPEEETINLMDAPIDSDIHTNLLQARRAGGFENTREMKLYSTFSIPLIHGWIPPRNHPAYTALKRSAQTYEDAQNLMFREEELEDKLQQQGLTPEEQMILEDIASVKYFLNSTATQLTGYGLDTMTESLAPGSIAILFRNDHFSTLYRHPRSGQLLTLVTDMGYAGHDEVVWESLVDVSGEGCEFFSGDFRPVGNVAGDTQPQPSAENQSGWTTVESKSRKAPRQGRSIGAQQDLPPLSTLNINDDTMPVSPNTEQEDHDLALAMQLQEEEEERDRQEAAARRREDELSQAYLNSSDTNGRRTFPGFGRGATGAESGPSPPPRGNGSGRHSPPPSRPPQRKSTSSEDAPPSYEQAAKGPAYVPPVTHPAHPNASPGSSNSTPRPQGQRPRQSSAYSEHAASYSGVSPTIGPSARRGHNARGSASGRGSGEAGPIRRRSGGPNSAISPEDGEKKDKDCIVM